MTKSCKKNSTTRKRSFELIWIQSENTGHIIFFLVQHLQSNTANRKKKMNAWKTHSILGNFWDVQFKNNIYFHNKMDSFQVDQILSRQQLWHQYWWWNSKPEDRRVAKMHVHPLHFIGFTLNNSQNGESQSKMKCVTGSLQNGSRNFELPRYGLIFQGTEENPLLKQPSHASHQHWMGTKSSSRTKGSHSQHHEVS